jgi:hypothetical protein
VVHAPDDVTPPAIGQRTQHCTADASVREAIDPSRTDLVTRHFREDIIGWARQQPGFVCGQWLLSPGQKQGMGVVVFATEDAAAAATPGRRQLCP